MKWGFGGFGGDFFFPSKSCVRTNIFTDYRVILNYAPEKDDHFSKEDFLKVTLKISLHFSFFATSNIYKSLR